MSLWFVFFAVVVAADRAVFNNTVVVFAAFVNDTMNMITVFDYIAISFHCCYFCYCCLS